MIRHIATVLLVLLLAQAAAAITVSGSVVSTDIFRFRAVTVTIEGDGVLRTTRTSPFGYYRFTGVPANAGFFVYPGDLKPQPTNRIAFDPERQLVLTQESDIVGVDFTFSALCWLTYAPCFGGK